MPAPAVTSLPELPSFPSGPGLPDQPGVFIPKFLTFLAALQNWPAELAALVAYLEGLGGGGGGGSVDWGAIGGTLEDQADLTAYIAAQVAALVDAAPGALDTLNELAAALGDDANFASTVTTALAGKQDASANLDTFAGIAPSANVQSLLAAASYAAFRTALDLKECFPVAVSDESTAITTGDGKITFHCPYDGYLLDVFIGLSTVSSSGAVTVDVELAGASVFDTLPSIDAGEETSLTGTTAVMDGAAPVAVTKGQKFSVNIDAAGTGAKGLKAYFYIRR